jgi:hypothetical protein
MILIDVSILVYAHRTDADDHATYRNGLDETLNSAETYGLCGTGLVRNGANRHSPANLCRSHADRPGTGTLELANRLRDHDSCVVVSPGGRIGGFLLNCAEPPAPKVTCSATPILLLFPWNSQRSGSQRIGIMLDFQACAGVTRSFPDTEVKPL